METATAIAVDTEPAIVLVEWFDDHWYKITVNGQTHYLPSVTTKLGIVEKPNLSRWRGDVGNREADLRMHDAGQKGKRIHWAWAVALEGGAVVYDPWQMPVYTPEGIADLKDEYGEVAVLRTQEEMWDVDKLRRQFAVLKPKVIDVEKKLFDLTTRDAGTADAVYWVDEGEYLINGSRPLCLPSGVFINDLKTGSGIYDEAWYQTAKYMDMYEKTHGIQCAGTMITHTGASMKNGVPGLATKFHSREEVMDHDLPMYHKIAAVWDGTHADAKPDTFEFPSMITLNLNQKGELRK